MIDLRELHRKVMTFEDTSLMPLLFVGHGSPMNAIENNEFVRAWNQIGSELPRPKAIVCISAHWETRGTFVTAMNQPKTIHDFYGFPQELYQQQYPVSGSQLLAQYIHDSVNAVDIGLDYEWGIDHGSWSVLKHIYPLADIPVIQISLDHFKDPAYHYNLGEELLFLRRKGILVIGSGNMVHNLRMLQFKSEDFNAENGYDWAFEINDLLKEKIRNSDHQSLVAYNRLNQSARLAIPTPEHYIPMLYVLAMQQKNEKITFFNDKVIGGSISMTSFLIGDK